MASKIGFVNVAMKSDDLDVTKPVFVVDHCQDGYTTNVLDSNCHHSNETVSNNCHDIAQYCHDDTIYGTENNSHVINNMITSDCHSCESSSLSQLSQLSHPQQDNSDAPCQTPSETTGGTLKQGSEVRKSETKSRFLNCCLRLTGPLEAENHPLPPDPRCFDHFQRAFFCPPFGRVGAVLLVLVAFFLWWGVLIAVTKDKALPGGVVFPMIVLFACCWCGGYAANLVRLPPLFGK